MFDQEIREFDNNILSLRTFVQEIKPFLENKRKETLKNFSPLILDGLRNSFLKEHFGESEEMLLKANQALDKMIVEKFGEKLEVEIDVIEKEKSEDGLNRLKLKGITIKGSSKQAKSIAQDFEKYDTQIQLLYRNSLLSLLSSIEWFFSQILHIYYSKHPKAAGIDKKTLTLDDLKTFETIKDAENFLIDSKIEGILRSSFEDWVNILDTEIKLGLTYLKPVKNELIEIYQRRNIIIHSGGKVNSIYLSKVDRSLSQNIKIGDSLSITEDYLEKAICIFHRVFILIASELWKSIEPDKTQRADTLIEITYENLLKENWIAAEGFSFFLSKDAKMGPIDKTIGQLNYWLCKKKQGQWETIKKEVQDADFSDKTNILQLGLMGLREEKENFLSLIPTMLKSEEISVEKIMEFPIFSEIRQTPEFEVFINTSQYFEDLNVTKKSTTVEKENVDSKEEVIEVDAEELESQN